MDFNRQDAGNDGEIREYDNEGESFDGDDSETKNAAVILSEQSESKDPGSDCAANRDRMRRFLDFAALRSE